MMTYDSQSLLLLNLITSIDYKGLALQIQMIYMS